MIMSVSVLVSAVKRHVSILSAVISVAVLLDPRSIARLWLVSVSNICQHSNNSNSNNTFVESHSAV